MEWLNYHHLYYFWVVARTGSITRAAAELRVAQPTISGQLRALETALEEKVFAREGRGLVLTDAGRSAFGYADKIFLLGRQLQDSLRGLPTARPARFVVGIADGLPKLVSYQLLAPALELPEPIQLVCRQDKPERLLADLSIHALDLVLADTPIGSSARVRAFNHVLGECGVTLFASAALTRYRRGFPKSLDGAPMVLPAEGTTLRRSLMEWFDSQGVRPRIVAECEDSALLKVLGQAGRGIVAAPSVATAEIRKNYRLEPIGRADGVRERFYAISLERRLKHPAVVAIYGAARDRLFE